MPSKIFFGILEKGVFLHDGTKIRYFYHTMHYSAKRGLAIACRLSICHVGK